MLDKLTTETRNEKTMNLDQMSVIEILKAMNDEDRKVPEAITSELENIGAAVELAIDSLQKGGRLVYLGAGTSGRLGVLDAAECPPTFGTDPGMVVGLIAGGEKAMQKAVEGAEDSLTLAEEELRSIHLSPDDTLVGIAASGRTPYVIGGLRYAKQIGASTVSIACNKNAEISGCSDIAIEIAAGPEVLTGSTRLKAGTAQKLVLNMISTASMIGIGKVYKNLMVDVQPTNQKLMERAVRIIMEAAETDRETAVSHYEKSGKNVKAAIVMILTGCSKQEAEQKIKKAKGFVRNTLT